MFADIEEKSGRTVGLIGVSRTPFDQPTVLHLHEGDQQTVDGATVHVLHIWRVLLSRHMAIDVRVTGAS